MFYPKSILCPVDFSAYAGGALLYALDLAVRFDASLHVLHVIEGEQGHAVLSDAAHPQEESLEIRMREAVSVRLGGIDQASRDMLRIDYEVGRDVAAAHAILRYVEDHRIDLIVMGTHGRRGIRRLLLGSVAEETVHGAPCDVLAVHTAGEGALERLWDGRVLVPVDLSWYSEKVLGRAKGIAESLGAELDLLHAIEPASLPVFSIGRGGGSVRELMPELKVLALGRLEGLLKETAGPAVGAEVHVREGHPAYEVADFARSQDTALIVIGAHGFSNVPHRFLGGITERVLRSVSCPVWVVRVPAAEPGVEEPTDAEEAQHAHAQ